ncbi:protein tiptop [Lasius niger]|uniref:Protein tiptop n=1 Tax=Lasius niger TaxID=67767 RepID=A0A0J7LB20_LASNI|nr:protein tiptop [Lasius niger]
MSISQVDNGRKVLRLRLEPVVLFCSRRPKEHLREDGVEGSAPGTDLQGEEGDCVDEDGPISPSERGCAPVAKEDEDADGTDEEDDEEASPPTPPPSATSRLNPTILRDTGPPDREPMSPRCPSRDSRESSGPATGSPPPPATRSSASPVSPNSIVPLPLGTHPLLPSHSAAVMAAYLQQTHQPATPGLLVSPTSVGEISPSATPLPAVLDFSTRKASSTEEDEEEQILNLSKPPTPSSSTETNNAALWNGKMKPPTALEKPYQPSEATKALEKMSELSKLGGEDLFRSSSGAAVTGASAPATTSSSRHSAWQSHWLNKGADQAKDVLKCVWCKQSFPTLAAMTTHMKEAKHCGVNMPVPPPAPGIHSQQTSMPTIPPPQQPHQPQTSSSNTGSNSSATPSSKQSPSDLNLLIKETMPLPRKLVRGQDVWLGKGAEQTRQILKCMWCGQSFRSLAEMTSHMQQTQHYTNIISQEQIISWKSSDESKGANTTGAAGGGASAGGGSNAGVQQGGGSGPHGGNNGGPGAGATSSHVSAVLTCKEHIMRSITESGGRRRQTREKRKNLTHSLGKQASRITCEKCGEKIETPLFVEHIRQCIGAGTVGVNQRNFLKNALMSNHLPATLPPTESGQKLIEKSFDSRVRHGTSGMHHAQPGAPMGTSILKRLGIDESVDYTKPLHQQQHYNATAAARRERSGSESSSISERGSGRTDTMTPERRMDLSTTSHERHSSSLSHHHRVTPEKQSTPLPSRHHQITEESGDEESSTVVKEIVDDCRDEEDQSSYNHRRRSHETPEDGREVLSPRMNPPTPRPTSQVEQIARSPCRNSTSSPTSSDRSVTPRGTPDTKASSSLGALSSMFDSLSGGGGGGGGSNVDSQGRKTSSHPLAALQKLCDKTETRGPSGSGSSRSGGSSGATIGPGSGSTVGGVTGPGPGPTPGAILAFSWACNDAVVTADSIMKCAFCDTPFISKGAYRHHLSKMHFVKDGVIPDPLTIGRSAAAAAAAAAVSQGTSGGPSRNSSSPPTSQRNKSPPLPQANGSPSQSAASPLEESPHSKFLKYTELAKQLSRYRVMMDIETALIHIIRIYLTEFVYNYCNLALSSSFS